MTFKAKDADFAKFLLGWAWGILKIFLVTCGATVTTALLVSYFNYDAETWLNRNVSVPTKQWYQARARPDIPREEALRLAKVNVGSRTVMAIPFHNIDDPNQYIAVWTDSGNDECEPAATCPLGWGTLELNLMVGGGVYQNFPTHNRAISLVLRYAADDPEEYYPVYFALTDWNGDGAKEVLSFSDQNGMTAGYEETFVSLFDTKTRVTAQLRAMASSTDRSVKMIGSEDPALHAWLIARYDEYQRSKGMRDCLRDIAGDLNCPETPSDDIPDEDQPAYENREKWINRWVEMNGGNFTFGKITPAFSKELYEIVGGSCSATDGKQTVSIEFKGEIFLTNEETMETTVLYVQDGRHHREIPGAVIGKRYFWLALAAEGKMIAIERETLESKAVNVENWSLVGEPESPQVQEKRKDVQLDGFDFERGYITGDGKRLKLSIDETPIDRSEFKDAKYCNPSAPEN